MGLFELLGQLLDAILSFIPRPMVVRATHKAVKFKRGKAKIIDAGWRWWWPLTTEIETHPVVSQPLDLPPQTLMTKDGQSVVVGGVALFRIVNLMAYAVENYDSDEAMIEVAGSAIRDAVVGKTLEQLQEADGRKAINKTLEAQGQRELSRFGVEVEYFKLTDLSICRVLNIVGGGQAVVVDDD
jgi:regulator of protease activity HflC (stomatin/prohibitin superfamily)